MRPGRADIDDDAVGEEHGLLDGVRDEQTGEVVLEEQVLEHQVEPGPGELVERAERLVEEEDLGVEHEGPGE